MKVCQLVPYARKRETVKSQNINSYPCSPGHLCTAVNLFLLRWLRASPYVELARVCFFSRLLRGPKASPRGTRQSSKSREEAPPRPSGSATPLRQRRAGTCVPPSVSATPAVSDGTGDRPFVLSNTDRAAPLSRVFLVSDAGCHEPC